MGSTGTEYADEGNGNAVNLGMSGFNSEGDNGYDECIFGTTSSENDLVILQPCAQQPYMANSGKVNQCFCIAVKIS